MNRKELRVTNSQRALLMFYKEGDTQLVKKYIQFLKNAIERAKKAGINKVNW